MDLTCRCSSMSYGRVTTPGLLIGFIFSILSWHAFRNIMRSKCLENDSSTLFNATKIVFRATERSCRTNVLLARDARYKCPYHTIPRERITYNYCREPPWLVFCQDLPRAMKVSLLGVAPEVLDDPCRKICETSF